MDCTDKHFRMIMRKISSKALLYTEMIVAQSLIHTENKEKFLNFNSEEHPLSIQFGGDNPQILKEAAKMVISKKIDFENLKNSDYKEAKRNLRLIPGIGNKVADCIMLFSLNKLDAFPLDTWMIKILEKYYSKEFQIETKTITEKQYEILHEKIVDYFGPNCGFAQQFLFKMERENYEKKWL